MLKQVNWSKKTVLVFSTGNLDGNQFVTEYAWKDWTEENDEGTSRNAYSAELIPVQDNDPYVLKFESSEHGTTCLDARNMFHRNSKAAGLGRYIVPNRRKSNVVLVRKPERKSTWGFSVRSGLTIGSNEEIFR